MHREDMMQFVYMPRYYNIEYQNDFWNGLSKAEVLSFILDKLEIGNDPYVKVMRQKNDPRNQQKLFDAITKRKTPCLEQLTKCSNRMAVIHEELGPWAANSFLTRCMKQLRDKYSNSPETNWTDWDREDHLYITSVLSQVTPSNLDEYLDVEPNEVSTKVNKLIDFLENEHVNGSIGIIFARERSTVVMLTHLLSLHPRTKHIGTIAFLGSSSFASRKSDITELHNTKAQMTALDDLRNGKKNLIIATSVLEEGIDVPACDLVICFDFPQNLRSFIQRRGRARKKGSKFALFVDIQDHAAISTLKAVEETMKGLYLENERTLEELQLLEEAEEDGYDGFRIKSTGALLTLSNARNHLSHFCGILACEYADTEPTFMVQGDELSGLSAKVILPNFFEPRLREFRGISTWRTERMAKRDAAFQAYVALYKAGLVNDYLMPINHRENSADDVGSMERPSFANVSDIFDPWATVANQWQKATELYQSVIEISTDSQVISPMLMVLPVGLPCDISFRLFWDENTTFLVSATRTTQKFAAELVSLAADTTSILLSSLFSQKMMPGKLDFSWLFLPRMDLIESSIKEWCKSVRGKIFLNDIEKDSTALKALGLVRRIDNRSRPFTFEDLVWKYIENEATDGANVNEEDTASCEVLHVEGKVWPKRTDFLHPVANLDTSKMHHTAKCFHPASECTIDKLPIQYTRFTLFIPCLIHNIEKTLIADELARTILRPVKFSDLSLVLTAISSSVAREASNYQRLEFLGDSLLKLYTSIELAAKNLQWPEGLLTSRKSHVVSNSHLAKAATETGLDRFILTKPFSGAKWRPSYNTDHVHAGDEEGSPRVMSTKVLADVVEALIGAANIDGADEKTLDCLKVFLPEINWSPLDESVGLLYRNATDSGDEYSMVLPEIEELLGYTFTKKSLVLAALTHPSSTTSRHSYQRLEFIGDSVLDIIVVQALFGSPREFAHYNMHLMRTALVNADFLAFLCMNVYVEKDRGEAVENIKKKVKIEMTKRKSHLWGFMKHSQSWDIVHAQNSAIKQHEELQEEINERLNSSQSYPWTLLCRLDAAKFFSDIIESILGAIFIDSQGSMSACEAFLERIGLMRYVRRVLSENIDFMHPKQRLGHLANALSVRYETKQTLESEARRWECTVRVGDEEIVRVGDGISNIEAETRAAEAAVAVLRTRECRNESQMPDDGMSE
ncbi:predicted protein [Uncinocarpus reesii 1704]|uniref:Dicer-like protein 2 n=1 Tax=Uncinocarpus reesii (strain UAMH 1704) TaxID=336963 RepID=C4JXB1_UNCRE|nr:uncharacterized protein UREG_06284 [Uncinocarpus reesii 1704]EEP81419.1 predicted protein [Uncinocarpus reesii 1704]